MPFHIYKDLSLAYDLAGAGEKALLFIHGLGGAGSAWKCQTGHFGDRFVTVTVDLFGHGRSSKEVDPIPIPRIDAEAIDSLMREKIGRPYIVIGHSFAGMVIQEMLRLADPNFKGAVFVDCTHTGNNEIVESRVSFAESMLALSAERLPEETKRWYSELVGPSAPAEDREFILSTLKDCDYRWLFRSVAGCREFCRKYPPGEIIVRPDFPVLVMEADNGIGGDWRKSWVNFFKDAGYYLFEDAYHFFFITERSRFNKIMDEFLGVNF